MVAMISDIIINFNTKQLKRGAMKNKILAVAWVLMAVSLPAVASKWVNAEGSRLECGDWLPKTSQIELGKEFEQVRRCLQEQVRGDDTRTIPVIEKQNAVGALQARSKTSYASTGWVDVGSPQYGKWMPVAFNQRNDFVQTRRVRQNSQRLGKSISSDLYGGSGSVKEKMESRVRTYTESRQVSVRMTEWSPVSNFKVCDRWSTDAEGRVRACRQKEIRYIQYLVDGSEISRTSESRVVSLSENSVGNDGVEGTNGVKEEGRTVVVEPYNHTPWLDANGRPMGDQFKDSGPGRHDYLEYRDYSFVEAWNVVERDVYGRIISQTRERKKHDDTETRNIAVQISGWLRDPQSSNPASYKACSSWSPAPSSAYKGSNINQRRNCTVFEKREREFLVGSVPAMKKSDKRSRVELENKVLTYFENGWQSQGMSCSSWSPSQSSVYQGETVRQSRTCNEAFVRSYGFKSGPATVFSDVEHKSERTSDRRTRGGTKNPWKSIGRESETSSTGWKCGSWSPSPSTVERGKNFTQKKTCTRTTTRTSYTVYQNQVTGSYKEGPKTKSSSKDEDTQTRRSTGTKRVSGV